MDNKTQLETSEISENSGEASELARDAEALQAAKRDGRLIASIPIASIEANYLQRDRQAISIEELDALKRSIFENGMRMPIEVVKTGFQNATDRYGLISGFRRLSAVRLLSTETLDPKWQRINVIVRPRIDEESEYVAMVEENEVRQNLTYYERGRIVDLAVKRNVYEDVDQALAALFPQASRSKRSKVRSFAAIHDELDAHLSFTHALGERNGLKLASALREGKGNRIRRALEEYPAVDAEAEWAIIENAMRDRGEKTPKALTRIGRALEVGYSGKPGKFKLEFIGRDANDDLKTAIMTFVRELLR